MHRDCTIRVAKRTTDGAGTRIEVRFRGNLCAARGFTDGQLKEIMTLFSSERMENATVIRLYSRRSGNSGPWDWKIRFLWCVFGVIYLSPDLISLCSRTSFPSIIVIIHPNAKLGISKSLAKNDAWSYTRSLKNQVSSTRCRSLRPPS